MPFCSADCAPMLRWYSTVMENKQGRVDSRPAVQRSCTGYRMYGLACSRGKYAERVRRGWQGCTIQSLPRTELHTLASVTSEDLCPLRCCGSCTSEGISGTARTGIKTKFTAASEADASSLHALAAPSVRWDSDSK